MLTSLKGAVSGAGAEASLLHHSNLKSARKAVDNLRLASNGGGKQVATLSQGPHPHPNPNPNPNPKPNPRPDPGKQVATLSQDYYREAKMWLTERCVCPRVQRAILGTRVQLTRPLPRWSIDPLSDSDGFSL